MKNFSLKLIAFIVLISVSVLPAKAYSFASGGFFYNLLPAAGEVEITSEVDGNTPSYTGVLHIPEQVFYNGVNYKVTAIGNRAFANSEVTGVDIPNSITTIGEGAFYFANKLANITLPLGLTSVSKSMLEGTAISNIAIPEGVTVIKNGAFQTCTNLHTVLLPSTLNQIEAYGFNNCHSLKEIYCAAKKAPEANGWAIFIALTGIDLIVPEASVDAYTGTTPWNIAETFTVYPSEPVGVSMDITGKAEGNWDVLYLGNSIAFKIYDGDKLMAITAADVYYLPHSDLDKEYTIVPTNYFADGTPVKYKVAGTSGVSQVSEDEQVKIYANSGIIYIAGDNYGKSVRVYDAYGNLCRAQTITRGEIEGLPTGKVYIVVCGNTIKKIWL